MEDSLKIEIKVAASNLLSTVIKCQEENARLLEIVRNMQYSNPSLMLLGNSYASGDAAGLNPNKRTSTPHFPTAKLTQNEYICLLIKNATDENSRLRESNVKLKLESKSQEQKIKELNRKMMLHERIFQNQESQRETIKDLKKTITGKAGEIRLLKNNLENVKSLLIKEQKKSRSLQEHKASAGAQSKLNTEVHSKLDTLLMLTNQLLKDQEQAKSAISCNSCCVGKVQKVLSRLIIMNNNLVQQQFSDVSSSDISPKLQKIAYDNRQAKINAGIQECNRNLGNYYTNGTYSILSEAFTRSNVFTPNSFRNLRGFKKEHRRYKSA